MYIACVCSWYPLSATSNGGLVNVSAHSSFALVSEPTLPASVVYHSSLQRWSRLY